MLNQNENLWIELTKLFLAALAITVFIRSFLFAPIVVDGSSMMPTLHDQDKMLVNKIDYHLHDPKRFDIIVFHASENKDFIKRIIGLPGEHVEVRDQVLYIDGEKVSEPFLVEERESQQERSSLFENFTLEELPGGYDVIPEDKYLVLGDNRSNSTDSRVIGLISKKQIVGKTNLIIWPIDRWQTLDIDQDYVEA